MKVFVSFNWFCDLPFFTYLMRIYPVVGSLVVGHIYNHPEQCNTLHYKIMK